MTKRISVGEIISLRRGRDRVDSFPDVAAPTRLEHPRPANDTGNDPGKVVPFMRPRGNVRSAPPVALPTDAARLPGEGRTGERAWRAALFVVSFAVHAGLFVAFWREPTPFASIGVEVMSLEIVVGATAPAGVAVTTGEQQANFAVARETESEKTQERATAQDQTAEIARQETAPELKSEDAKPFEQKPEAAIVPEQPAAEQKPAVAMVETPALEAATARPQETPPAMAEVTLPPPEQKTVERQPARAAPSPKPVKDAKPASEPRRIAAPTRANASREAKASLPSTAANNVGVGRSDRSSNYPGLVSAHLRRFQQYPSDARSRGDQGTATVSFSLDGGGRVTSARLARASGYASLDQEVQAMVRRASPFPAPPDGRAQSFTVPVSFRLN